jgi:hypothetical protein
MDIRKLSSKFVTQLCEKNYSGANSTLEELISEKTKKKVKNAYEKMKEKNKNKKC